jgi:glutathione S-transferase
MSSSTAPPLQLLGLPFSTYTRTITLALSAVDASFQYTHVPPHDDRLAPHSPFGLLPVLLHGDLTLYESRAVAGYLSAQLPALRSLFPQDAAAAARAERWISLLSSQLFPLAEPRLVKARHALEEEGVAEEEVAQKLQPAVEDMHALLEKLEPLVEAEAGPWLVAGQKSWADYFVLPPLADLEATPEVSLPSAHAHQSGKPLMLESRASSSLAPTRARPISRAGSGTCCSCPRRRRRTRAPWRSCARRARWAGNEQQQQRNRRESKWQSGYHTACSAGRG